MVSNAQATTKGAIILLTNFVFISVIFFHCFGLPWLPTVGGHFWPFTQVLRKIWPGVTRKVGKTADDTDVTDGFLDWRLTQTHYNWMPDWARWVRQPPGALPVSYLRYPCNPWVNSILAQGSRLLFLAEFLESGFAAQRVPDRIESKKGWRNGRSAGTRGIGRV